MRGGSEKRRGERGQALVLFVLALAEYALILAFVFIACVTVLGFLGLAILGGLDSVMDGFPTP